MTTTSANIAGTPQPFAMTGSGTRPWPYGAARVYSVADLKPRKKRKKKDQGYGGVGMLYVGQIGGLSEEDSTAVGRQIMRSKRKGPRAKVVDDSGASSDKSGGKGGGFTEPVGNPKDNLWKIPKLGKIGVWRTVRGRRYFFPSDGSSSIPKMPGGKKGQDAPKESPSKGKTKKKGGILSKIIGKVTGMIGGGGGAKASLKDVKPKAVKGESSGGAKREAIPNRKDMLKDVETTMLQARRSKGGKKVASALKKMQKALQSDDSKAFKDAESSLARATQKLAKKRGG